MDNPYSLLMENLPWGIGITAGLMVLFIFAKIWKGIVSRKVKNMGGVQGMSMMDADTMHKKGLISEEEYRRIRGALAQREMQKIHEREQFEREREILAKVEENPEAARQLIDPALIVKKHPVVGKPTTPNLAAAGSSASSLPANTKQSASSSRPSSSPLPSSSASSPQPGDLDFLLAKGAISQEEYERLKKFFT